MMELSAVAEVTPVSYTHLDVYKRQNNHSTRVYHRFNYRKTNPCRGVEAVSYTHLDVYKRQLKGSLSLRLGSCPNLAANRNSLAHSTKGTPSQRMAAPTACRHTVSGLSLIHIWTPLPVSRFPSTSEKSSLSGPLVCSATSWTV